MELKQIHEEMQRTWADFRKVNDEIVIALKANTGAVGLMKEAQDRINTRLDSLESEVKAAKRPAKADDRQDVVDAAERKAAFMEWVRFGQVSAERSALLVKDSDKPERKTMTIGNQATGGFLAPVEYVREIIKGVTEFSPVRQLARIRTTGSKAVQIPKRTGVTAATWVGETTTQSEATNPTYGLEELSTHELTGYLDVSNEDLEDSAFDLEGELAMEMADAFATAEGAAFISGTGVVKPEGLLTNGSVSETNSGHASTLTADGFVSIFYDVKDAYARNAVWLMKRATIKAVRQLKDGQNQYLWAPGLAGGEPSTLLGRPIYESLDMPSISAGTYPVIFGDVRRAYLILDRLAVSLLRDNLTQANRNVVRIYWRKRVGGQVVLPEAIRKMKVSA
jgi:HK97 family phage major capsid protein